MENNTKSTKRERARLLQYRMLVREIERDRRRLAEVARRIEAADPHRMPGNDVRWLEEYGRQLGERVNQSVRLLAELQAYINTIEDSEMRLIFTLHYIDGKSWQKVAFAIGEYDESYPRKKHNAYIRRRCIEEEK